MEAAEAVEAVEAMQLQVMSPSRSIAFVAVRPLREGKKGVVGGSREPGGGEADDHVWDGFELAGSSSVDIKIKNDLYYRSV